MFASSLAWLRQLPHHVSRLLPCECALCGELAPDPVCPACDTHYFSGAPPRCACCGIRLPFPYFTVECASCRRNRPAFDATVVATDYAPPVDRLVLALKFGRQLALAPAMSRLLMRTIECSSVTQPDLLLAVPLGSRRLAERGFNQSVEIARALSSAWRLPLEKQGIVRQRETPPQSLLAPDERRRNIRRAFAVPLAVACKIKERHILLVDDVMTTGATLNEVALTLKRAGAARVTNLVFARALPQ